MKDQKPDAQSNAGTDLTPNRETSFTPNGETSFTPNVEASLTPPPCPRAGDLMSYLYKEATPPEARSFTEHLSACAACRDELEAFGGVRASVGAWRAEALGVAASLGFDGAPAQPSHVTTPPVRERSALAALREFFALSPRWMQGASVAAALLFCALAALTLARAEVRWDAQGLAVRTSPSERIVEKRTDAPAVVVAASRAELDALAAERDRFKSELEALRTERQQQSDAATLNASATPNRTTKEPRRSVETQVEVVWKDSAQRKRAPRAASSRARELAGNRVLDEREEDNLPRLSDLLSEVK